MVLLINNVFKIWISIDVEVNSKTKNLKIYYKEDRRIYKRSVCFFMIFIKASLIYLYYAIYKLKEKNYFWNII